MNASQIPPGVVRFTHALVEDAALRSWFLSLDSLAPSLRRQAFSEMARQMKAAREDEELISAVAALAHPELYAAVRDAVLERSRI